MSSIPKTWRNFSAIATILTALCVSGCETTSNGSGTEQQTSWEIREDMDGRPGTVLKVGQAPEEVRARLESPISIYKSKREPIYEIWTYRRFVRGRLRNQLAGNGFGTVNARSTVLYVETIEIEFRNMKIVTVNIDDLEYKPRPGGPIR